MTTGEVIRHRRKELGLTLEQIGDAMGVNKSTIHKWENGIVENMRRDKIGMLADILQIEPIMLISPDEAEAKMRLQDWKASMFAAYKSAPEYTQRAICDMLKIEYFHIQEETEGKE